MKKRFSARFIAVFLTAALCLTALSDAVANRDRNERQAELDAICEEARQEKLTPMREQYVESCVENGEQRSREACERFYADFGAQSGGRAPLYFDLPECVEAFDFQNSQRQR